MKISLSCFFALFLSVMTVYGDEFVPAVKEKDTWSPHITLRNDVVKGMIFNGDLYDRNVGDELSLEFSFNKNFGISLFGRVPIEKTKDYDDDSRKDDYDYLGAKLGYNYTTEEIGVLGKITLSLSYTYVRFADIYSEMTIKNSIDEDEGAGWSKIVNHRQDSNQHYFTIGGSLDDVLLKPNASVVINHNGKFFAQFGFKFDYEIIQDKLAWNNSLDLYYFCKDYYESYVKSKGEIDDIEEYVRVIRIYNRYIVKTYEREISEEWNDKIEGKSDAGFKSLLFRSELDYYIAEHIALSIFGMVYRNLDNKRELVHDTEFLYGGSVRIEF